MNGLDYAILSVIGISALLGLWRGFVRETVSLLVWITAFGLAMTLSTKLAAHLSGVIANPSTRVAAAFIFIFVVVLVVGVLVNYLLASLVKKAGLRVSDRVLGGMFGMVRGVLVVVLAVILVEVTPLVESAHWRGSTIVGSVQPVLGRFQKFFPTELHAGIAQGFGGFSR